MLGGGGYCVPRHVLAERDVSFDVVELDPGITEAAKSYFELEELRHSPDFQNAMGELRAQPSPSCQLCRHFDRCYGGCPVLWKNYSYEALMDFKRSVLGAE